MTKDETLKLALDALETSMYPQQKQLQAITAIKEALAQPKQDWSMLEAMQGSLREHMAKIKELESQRKPLTDEEIGAILEDVNAYGTRLYTFARAIEAAHGIKGEA